MTEIHELSALEQAAAVRTGTLGPTELVDHYLARIAAYDAGLGAFVTVTPDAATAQAAASTRRDGGPWADRWPSLEGRA